MTSAVLDRVAPVTKDELNENIYDKYYEEDYEMYQNPELMTAIDEAMAETDDILAHPEKYKFYDSVKEMLRDMGFDVSDLPDD